MSILLTDLVERIEPDNTVLFFGSGSSIPSGAPSAENLIELIGTRFSLSTDGYSLSEISSVAETKFSRKELITFLRSCFDLPYATGSILNTPLYSWKSIYTTNYDELIEQSYKRKNTSLTVYSNNFDFTVHRHQSDVKLFKLHGTISEDYSDGKHNRIIISESDYDNTLEYRDALYDTLKIDLIGSNLVIIGYSLSDQHIKKIVNKISDINKKSHLPANIYLLLYEKDEDRALLYENRGIKVSFGGLDEFFVALNASKKAVDRVYSCADNPIESCASLTPVTVDINHVLKTTTKNVGAMYQGWPATYSDIEAQLTFERSNFISVSREIDRPDKITTIILGASGTGKSTFARQLVLFFKKKGNYCWEHKLGYTLSPFEWRRVANNLKKNDKYGIIFVDDAHYHLHEINQLIDLLISDSVFNLKIIATSSRNHWYPRIKTPNIFKHGNQIVLQKLDETEIENLLNLIDTCQDLQPLVEDSFSGFSRTERKRRLTTKCDSDTFVCLKNIFASDKFDDIVLREYAELDPIYQDIYKMVSAMENVGINVHRQLIIRLLGIPADQIKSILTNLSDIIHEKSYDSKSGIYTWKGRHAVISEIVTKYKMSDMKEYYSILDNVIDNIIPTYDIEIMTLRQLCDFGSGISIFNDKIVRNKLLRKMISKAPGERLPRHRLIRYLIDLGHFEKAETEIKLYKQDFKSDGAVSRFKIILTMERAVKSPGIMKEDRIKILEMAKDQSISALDHFQDNKHILRTYCDVGIQYYNMTANNAIFNDAIQKLRDAEARAYDPDITDLIVKYERKFSLLEAEEIQTEESDH